MGKLPGVEGWATSTAALAELAAWQRTLERPLPERECDFESLPFSSHGKDWATLVTELVRSGRPFRLTGLGTHLAPSSLGFASTEALLKGPLSEVQFEVGDIPYAADLRSGTEGNIARLGDYVRSLLDDEHRSQCGAERLPIPCGADPSE